MRMGGWSMQGGGGQIQFGMLLWLLLVPGLVANILNLPLLTSIVRLVVVAGLAVLASVLYLRRYPNVYRDLLLLGAGWALLAFGFHVLSSRYYLGNAWDTVWQHYAWLGNRVWPTTLLLILLCPFTVGLFWTGIQGLIAFLLWLRTTKPGMFALLVLWLVGTIVFSDYIARTSLSWLASLTMGIKLTSRLTDFSTQIGLLPALLVFFVLFAIVLSPASASGVSTYVDRLVAVSKHVSALPFGLATGLLMDWLLTRRFESLSRSLSLDFTVALGQSMVHVAGSYGALIFGLLAAGYWTWKPLK